MYQDVDATIYIYICMFSSMVIVMITIIIISAVIYAAMIEFFQPRFILNQYYIDLKEIVSAFHRAINGASWIDYPSSWSETDESETDSETQSDSTECDNELDATKFETRSEMPRIRAR